MAGFLINLVMDYFGYLLLAAFLFFMARRGAHTKMPTDSEAATTNGNGDGCLVLILLFLILMAIHGAFS